MSGNSKALFLMDTNIVLYFLGGRLANPLPEGQYFSSVITEIELLSYPNLGSDEEAKIREFLTQVVVVGLSEDIKELTISFRKKYRLKLPDAIITATANSLKATLLTNDAGLMNLVEVNVQSMEVV